MADRPSPGLDDKTVRLWEVESGRCLRVLEGHTVSVWSVAWSPDGRHALSGSEDKTVRLWEVASGRCLRVLEGHTASVWSVAWSPDGQHALSGAEDKTVRLWEVGAGAACACSKATLLASGAWRGARTAARPLRLRGPDRAAVGGGERALPARARRPHRQRLERGVEPGWPARPLRLR